MIERHKKVAGVVLVTAIFLVTFLCFYGMRENERYNCDPQEAGAETVEEQTVLLGGMPIGIYMETEGVLVLGTETLDGTDGMKHEPAKGIIKPGDYIIEINHKEIQGKRDLINLVKTLSGDVAEVKVKRGTHTVNLEVRPIECEKGRYLLGIWVRDNVQGLGTITYLTEDSRFGALGHGIHDVDTCGLMNIKRGRVYRTSIQDITKGEIGTPGSMEGMIVYNDYNILGTIDQNTDAGIYGKIDKIDELFTEQRAIKTMPAKEIKRGPATIRCFVDNHLQEYKIEIIDVDLQTDEINKGIIIQITDEELLQKTGGIIQGMSGSPILQNGKIVGAVTHVLVNDPTRGYGIFIENMLEQ